MVTTTPSARQVIAVATFLLDERRINAGEQAFLINLREFAKRYGDAFRMSARQSAWWDEIVDSHEEALAVAGVTTDA